MDNKDFDKYFSEQLGREQDFSFQEADWVDLNERMAAQRRKRRRFFLPFWTTAAALVLLGGIVYLWNANRMIGNEVEALRTEIAKLNNEKISDTVYREVVIVKTDTVFLNSNSHPGTTSLTTESSSVRKGNFASGTHQPGTLPEYDQKAPKGQQPLYSDIQIPVSKKDPELQAITKTSQNITPEKQPAFPGTDSGETVGRQLSTLNKLPSIPLYAMAQNEMPVLDLPVFFVREKPVKKRIKLDPGGQVGLSAGAGYADIDQVESYSGVAFADEDPSIFKRRSYSAGLHGELAFGEKIRLTSGVFYERLKLEVENYQSFENIPSAESIALQADLMSVNIEVLQNATVLQQTLNYDFGVKYAFESEKKWRPYLGAAILGQSNLKRNIEYAAKTDDANNYNDNELANLRASAPDAKPVFFYGIRGTLGTEYSISDHFGLHAESYYNHAFRTFEDRHLTLFGIRAGAYFKF